MRPFRPLALRWRTESLMSHRHEDRVRRVTGPMSVAADDQAHRAMPSGACPAQRHRQGNAARPGSMWGMCAVCVVPPTPSRRTACVHEGRRLFAEKRSMVQVWYPVRVFALATATREKAATSKIHAQEFREVNAAQDNAWRTNRHGDRH